MSYKCPCCGYSTLKEKPSGIYQACPVCYWDDDPVQFENENYSGGANRVSLKQAKENFKEFGAIQREYISLVREPEENEKYTSD